MHILNIKKSCLKNVFIRDFHLKLMLFYCNLTRHVIYRLLMSSEELRLFDKIRVFLDEDYSSAEHFTVSC